MRSSSQKTQKRKNFNHRKNYTPRGDPWAVGGRKKILVEILRTTYVYIRSRYWVLITKNAKLYKIQTIKKLTPQGGPLGRRRSKKVFARNFPHELDIRSPYVILITKNTKLVKIATIGKMTPQGGTLGPQKC